MRLRGVGGGKGGWRWEQGGSCLAVVVGVG